MELLMIGSLALIDLWAALPPAIIMRAEPLSTALIVGAASSLGVVATIGVCSAFRTWIGAKLGRGSFVGARTDRFMARYGTPGLGLLSPIILGPVLTCAGAIALGARARQLIAWAVVGVWLWACVFYAVLAFGAGSIAGAGAAG